MIQSRPAGSTSHIEAIEPVQPQIDDFELATTEDLLVQGGDGRLTLDPTSGANKYGCAPRPDPELADFGSSTASVISSQAHAGAEALHARLRAQPQAYSRELDRIRGELKSLNGLGAANDVDIVFAASGSDLHLLVRELVGGTPTAPLLCLGIEPQETGSGVPAALEGRHFSDRAALGEAVSQGCPIGPSTSAHAGGNYIAIQSRKTDGRLRDRAVIEAELDALCLHASKTGRRVLLTVTDVSKTGLISPDLDTVLALRRRFPQSLEMLIDACQFRLSAATLRAYLDNDLMVAVTGSKFLTGPVFSGALFVPPATAKRLRGRLLRPALKPYSARDEWPTGWVAGKALSDAANFGLLLRWEAALSELRAFRALPEDQIQRFTAGFAEAVQTRLANDPRFEPLSVRRLDRAAIGAPEGWDAAPTIFPFLMREHARPGAQFLSVSDTEHVYRSLMAGGVDGALRARLGQPVSCGERDGAPISALRLCNSARLIVQGVANPDGVIRQAMAVLDEADRVAGRLVQAGRIYS